jgi:4-amino-4-deoxy-L-arabinose transferase-like glycosyltransferase
MKPFIILLAIAGISTLCLGLFQIMGGAPILPVMASQLSSDGSIDAPIAQALKDRHWGVIITGLGFLLVSIFLYLCERNILGLYRWRERHFLVTIIIFKLALSLALIYFLPYDLFTYDDHNYYQYAEHFSRFEPILEADGDPTAWWPIGYPVLLAIAYRFTGPSIFVGQAINSLLLLGMILLAYGMAKHLFGPITARRTALILILTPSISLYSLPILSDPFFSFSIILVMFLALKREGITGDIFIGLVFGLAVLIRSVAMLLPFVLFIYRIMKRDSLRTAAVQFLLIFLVGELVLLPWQIRNYRAFGAFTLSSTNGGMHFWMGNNSLTSGGFIDWNSFISPETRDKLESLTETEKDRYGYQQGMSFVFAHPIQAISKWPKKLIFLYSKDSKAVSYATGGTYDKISPVVMMILIAGTEGYYSMLLLGFFLAVIMFFKEEGFTSRFWLLMGPTLYLTLIYMAFISEGRYHLPMIPVFALIVSIHQNELRSSRH